MADYEYAETEEDIIPMSIKSELYRLSSALNLDECEVDTERECINLIATAIRSIERIKSERTVNTGKGRDRETVTEEGTSQEKKLAAKAKILEDDLRVSLKTFDDAATLKSKITQLQSQLRKEREQRTVFEKFIESQNKKIMILISHVDKLMKALKRESGKTIKALESNRQLEKELVGLHQKVEKQSKVIAVQNRYVSEIAEGSKILQDQLALMDERYLELRSRLESSRKMFMTQMARITKESSELRVKYSMATHGKQLDTVQLPSHDMSFTGEGFRGSMETAELLHHSRASTGKGGKPRAKSARAALSSSSHHQQHQHQQQDYMRPGSPGSPGGRQSMIQAWQHDYPHGQDGITPHRNRAQQMFVDGITRNQKFAPPTMSPAEVEAKEKYIVKKISSKNVKGDPARWTDDKLHELLKGTS